MKSMKVALLSISIAAATLSSVSPVFAHDDINNGHYYADDNSQGTNTAFNVTSGWSLVNTSGAGGQSSITDVTSSISGTSYQVANWYVTTKDYSFQTGAYYGWDVYIPSYGATLNDSTRYFKEGSVFTTINQNSYKGAWITLGSPWMSDSTTYRYSVDNYRPAFDYRWVIADASHWYD